MTSYRPPRFLLSLAFVSMCSACVGTASQMPMSENERAEKVAEARADLSEARARLDLVAAKTSLEQQRWGAVLSLAQKVYDSGHFKAEAGYLLGTAQARHGSHLAALETYREVRKIDPSAVSDDEFEEALGLAISQVDYREPERRLELRMELVRMAPEHPSASAAEIRADLERLAHHHHTKGNWEAMLEAVETLATSPSPADQSGGQNVRDYGFSRAIALWHLGEKARAKEIFEAYLGDHQANPDDHVASARKLRLSKVISFFADKDEHQYIIELYEREVGRVSYDMSQERLELIKNLAQLLLDSEDDADNKRGERLLRYYVERAVPLVPAYRKDDVYARVRRLAERYGLFQFSSELLDEAIENGSASRYMVESRYKDAIRRGSPEQARALADKYLQVHRSASGLWDVARWARGAGQWEAAYEYMSEALEARPQRDKWWLEFARVALKLDKKKQAVEAVQNFVTNGATSRWDVQSAAGFLSQAGMPGEAIRVVTAYHKQHPNDSRTTTYLASLMIGEGQRDRAIKMLRGLAEDPRTRLYQVMEVSRYVQREFGDDEAFDFYVIAGERGEPEGYVSAASIAMSSGDLERYDKLAAKYLEADSLSFYDYRRLWYVLRDTHHQKRKLALLEKMIDARGAGNRQQYRRLLTMEYIRAGRSSDAFALWEKAGSSRAGRAFTELATYFQGAEVREKLIEEYRKRYPDDQASKWVLFFVAEQHYALYTLGQGRGDASLAEARRLYKLAFERIERGRSDYYAAAIHLEKRKMPDLAEEAMVRYVIGAKDDPAGWLQYAKLLLRQGRPDAAAHVMRRYIEASDQTGPAAVNAAGEFRRHLRNEQAEVFYKMALAYHENNVLGEREHRDILVRVGDGLGQLYLTSGRLDDFMELTSDFSAKYMGHHPHLQAHERHIDLNGLESRGRWSEFVERVEQLPQEGSQSGLSERHAKALWYLGQRKQAWKAFEEHLSQPGYDTDYQWLKLAEFLETRGGEVFAATAYDRAVRHGGRYRQGTALIERGRFLVRQGHYEAAIADFFAAQKSSRYGGQVENAMVDAFDKIGRRELAVEAMQREDSPFQKPGQTGGVAADIELEDISPDKIVAHAKSLASKGHSLEDLLDKLSDAGHFEAIATIIDERVNARDLDSAAKLVFAYADELAAVDRLRPIIEQLQGSQLDVGQQGVERLLADYYLQTGQPERALAFVQRDGGLSSIYSALALELALGRERALSNSLSYWMESYLHSSRTRRNLPLAVEFIRFGQQRTLSSVLERFTRLEQSFGAFAGTYVSDLLAREGVGAVVAFLRRTGEQLAAGDDAAHGSPQHVNDLLYGNNQYGNDKGRTLVRGAAVLAASGYQSEVEALLDELPESVRERHDVGALIERMALFGESSANTADKSAGSSLAHASDEGQYDSWRDLAAHARVLMLRGDYAEAETLVSDAFEAMIGYDTTEVVQGSVPSTQRESALRLMLRLYRTTGDHEGVGELIEIWLEHVGRDNFSADGLIEALNQQGFYDHAARVARQVAEDFPTGQILQKAILAAARVDDRETVEALVPVYWRQLGTNGRELGGLAAGHLVRRFDPKIAQLLLEPHLEANPKMVDNRVSEILVALRAEEVERGRALITAYLDEFDDSGDAILRLVRGLNNADYPVEVARVIGPHLEGDAASKADEPSVELLHEFAEANATIGRYKDAARYLDAIVSRAANPQLEASKISRGLTLAGHRALGLKFAERAFSEAGGSEGKSTGVQPLSHAYLARGLARLAHAQSEADHLETDQSETDQNSAVEDLTRGLDGRQGNSQLLSAIAFVALEAEQYAIAETYLTRLIRLPEMSTSSYNHPLRVIIEVVRRAEEERWGVAFLDRAVPELMQGAYLVNSFQWTELIGGLLTDAGMRERADAWFAQAIMFHRLDSDSEYKIDGLLDARALNLAVNGGDVDQAAALSREALASTNRPRYDFLVTLALAQRRSGQAKEAHATFRQAIRAGKPFSGNDRSIDAYLQSVLDGGSRRLRTTGHEYRSLSSPIQAYRSYRYNSSQRGYGRHSNRKRQYYRPRSPSPPIQIIRGTN